jgi:acetyl-CoA carboxylase biotin carboxyl carrier protein
VTDVVAILDGTALRAPAPGWFHRTVAADHLIAPGDVLGELDVLGHITRVVAPRGPRARGIAKLPPGGTEARRAVGYGDVLVVVEPFTAGAAETVADTSAPAATADGLVFRAPSSGRYYGRAAPDKPAFVTAGQELATGATVCLLEVMKTFNRVTYAGAAARVRAVLVAEGADVNAGDPLLALEAL